MGAGVQPLWPPTQPLDSRPARNACRRNGAPSPTSASHAAGSMAVMLVEVFVRIERRHASASCGRDGLTIHVIRDVARGEYAGHAGGRRRALAAALDGDVAVTHVELAREDAGIGCVADRDECAGDIDVLGGAVRRGRLDAHAIDAAV